MRSDEDFRAGGGNQLSTEQENQIRKIQENYKPIACGGAEQETKILSPCFLSLFLRQILHHDMFPQMSGDGGIPPVIEFSKASK